MNLREWISNSQKLNDILQSEDRLKDKVFKVFDIVWYTVTDDIQISETNQQHTTCISKQRSSSRNYINI